jgi:hypothetical protein
MFRVSVRVKDKATEQVAYAMFDDETKARQYANNFSRTDYSIQVSVLYSKEL